MHYAFSCLLLLWQSIQISAYPFGANLLKPRAGAVATYGLTRVQEHASGSGDSESDAPAGQILDNAMRSRYLFPVEVEGQSFFLEIDTGSSDTWIIQNGFGCYNTFDRSTQTFTGSQDESVCNFGAAYTPGQGFEVVPNIYQQTCYGQTETTLRCVSGPLGWASVVFDGFTVTDQLLGAPDLSSYPARGLAEQSGILGMAFPNLTNAFDTTTGEAVPYASIMYNLFSSGATAANVFSLALSRDDSNNGNGGIMTIGGIPDLTDPAVNVSSNYVSAPWQYVLTRSAEQATFYSINVDSLFVGSEVSDPGLQVILDSGAPLFQVPTATAEVMNSYWSPAMDSNGGLECDAVLTQDIGINIGGASLYISSDDLIGQNTDGSCFSNINGSDGDELLIGDPFLKNVLAVFDWDNSAMLFYPRQFYSS